MSRENTRAALLDAGKQIFLEKGYNNAGIEAILQAAGVPKGSFYYYFESKEAFGLEVINRFAECIHADLDRSLGDQERTPLERFRFHFESVCARLESQQCRNGCLAGNLSQEMADQSELFRARLEEVFQGCVDRYVACLEQARLVGEIAPDLDIRELAEFWLNSWQGAVLRAKATRSTRPLKTFLNIMFGAVLQAQA